MRALAWALIERWDCIMSDGETVMAGLGNWLSGLILWSVLMMVVFFWTSLNS